MTNVVVHQGSVVAKVGTSNDTKVHVQPSGTQVLPIGTPTSKKVVLETTVNNVTTATPGPKVVNVGTPGPVGPPGPPGPAGGVYAPVTFSFGDASPAPIIVLSTNAEITLVSLQIEIAFNGAGASIKLGTVASPGLLMDVWQNDPSDPVVFETAPREELPAGTALILTIIPGAGATQGRGQFVVTTAPLA